MDTRVLTLFLIYLLVMVWRLSLDANGKIKWHNIESFSGPTLQWDKRGDSSGGVFTTE
jgi:hypothetical protein